MTRRQFHGAPANPSALRRYFDESATPVAALWFVMPGVILYEVGTWHFTYDPVHQTEQRIVAFSFLRDLLAAAGATARWVAPAAVVSILVWQTVLRKDPWRVSVITLLGMTLESLLLILPLLALGLLMSRIPLNNFDPELAKGLISSIGAGIYEELVFRLIAFAALYAAFVDFLGIRERYASGIILLVTAAGFSSYHYWGDEPFAVQSFVFRFVAGLYFGWLLITRGFGVTAGCHAAYDMFVIMRLLNHPVVN